MTYKSTITLALTAAVLFSACASNKPERRQGPGGRGPGMEMDPSKMEARRTELRERFLAKWDHNKDGTVACDDITLSRSRLFRRLDQDNDGALVSAEYRHAKFEDKAFLFYDFLGTDKNGDGLIDVDELIAVPHSQFQSMDNDGDCTITPPEMMAAMREARIGAGPDGDQTERKGRGGGKGRKGGSKPF